MIKGVVRAGAVYPLDPLPESWTDGQLVFVEEAESVTSSSDLDTWNSNLKALACQFQPDDFIRMAAILGEADQQAKQIVRREDSLGLVQ